MAPKKSKKDISGFEAFKANLAKERKGCGPLAAPGSAFASESTNQISVTVMTKKVKRVGQSIFSALALGLEVDPKRDGMHLELMDEWADDEALALVERSNMRRMEKKTAEEEARMKKEEEAVASASGLKSKGGKGRKLKKGKKAADSDGDEKMEDAGEEVVTLVDGVGGLSGAKEDENGVIKVPKRGVLKNKGRELHLLGD